MKPVFLCLALFGCAFLARAEENRNFNSIQQEVLTAELGWEQALTNRDAAALEKLYDDSLVYTHSNGRVDTKSSYIGNIKAGATRYESMKRDDIKVSLHGHTAVVTCHWEVHIVANGSPIEMNARYLHVYVQEKGGWKLVAHQSTRISP